MARAKKTSKKASKKKEVVKEETPQVEETTTEETPAEAAEAPAEQAAEEKAPETPAEEASPAGEPLTVSEAMGAALGETAGVQEILATTEKVGQHAVLERLAKHKNPLFAMLGSGLDGYMVKMINYPRIAGPAGADAQLAMYNMMKAVVEAESYDDFIGGLQIMTWWFKNNKGSYASADRINTFLAYWTNEKAKSTYTLLSSLFVTASLKGIDELGDFIGPDRYVDSKVSELSDRVKTNLSRLTGK